MIVKFSRPLSRAAPSDSAVSAKLRGEFACNQGLWSEADVQTLRRGILIHAIRALDNPCVGAKTRSDLLDWITSEEITPFSFTACCFADGLDADALRNLLVARFCRDKPLA